MTNAIDRCPQCLGELRIVSLDREERIRRRLGRSWLARCQRCSAEQLVVPDAWKRFVQAERDRKRAAAAATCPQLEMFP